MGAEADIDPVLGGELNVGNGAFVVQFPPNAISSAHRVRFDPPTKDIDKDSRDHRPMLYRFSLRAFDRSDLKKETKQFKNAVRVTVRYDPKAIQGGREQDLALGYWDVDKKEWRLLPGKVDTARHTVTALTNHFSDFGLTTAPDMQPYLPKLDAADTDLFLGAASTTYDIEVPSGRNGLAPKVSLSYSSANVEMMDVGTQASFVGAGWSLSTSYIARDIRDSYDSADDVFTLALNGAGYDLVRDDTSQTTYHTWSEQYWRIVYNPTNDSWLVTTNDGTKYQFGYSAGSRAMQWRTYDIQLKQETYAWWLEKVIDTHGNEIQFSYRHQTQEISCVWWQNGGFFFDEAVYPEVIRYNRAPQANFLTEIDFTYTARNDVRSYQTHTQCRAPTQRLKLDRIDVKTTAGGSMQVVRAYGFEYDYSTFLTVWNPGGQAGRLTLKKITRFGTDSGSPTATPLPPYTLSYRDNRLYRVNNGIGGTVSFTYGDSVSFGNLDALRYGFDWDFGGCATGGHCDPWTGNGHAGTAGDGSALFFGDITLNAYDFIPGARYILNAPVSPGPEFNPSSATASVFDGVSWTQIQPWTDIGYGRDIGGAFLVSHNADRLEIHIAANNGRIGGAQLTLIPTYYRVTSRSLQDRYAEPAIWTYAYEGAAMNTSANSTSWRHLAGDKHFYTQFRGHSKVTVTDPIRAKTVSSFKQDDVLLGRLWQVSQSGPDNAQYTRTQHNYTQRPIPVTAVAAGDQSNFVFVNTTLNETYDGQPTPKTTKTVFDYDNYGNPKQTDEYGESTAIYRTTKQFTYPNTTAWIVNKPGLTLVFDGASAQLSETRNYYDGASDPSATATAGNLSMVEVKKDGSTIIPLTRNTFDSYGNIIRTIDANNNPTTIEYDTLYNVFPITTTNALTQKTINAYDYRLGKLSSTTDPNQAKTSYTYDLFGRTASITAPLDQGYAATATYTYDLNPMGSKVNVKVRQDLGGTATPDYKSVWWFYDGLGRAIQQQSPGDNNSIILVNTAYDSTGRTSRVSNPYNSGPVVAPTFKYRAYMPALAGGAGGSAPTPTPTPPGPPPATYIVPDWGVPFTEHQYDVLGRENKTINPDKTFQTMQYSQWVTTITDANGHQRKIEKDAFGRTWKVYEVNQGATYTTQYNYDALDHLRIVTDNTGTAVAVMNYDWPGRKSEMTDVDLGHWYYAYDDDGNLTRQTDAKNQTTCSYYDELNRLKGKNYRSDTACPSDPGSGYTVRNMYDQGTNGIWRRTSMNDPSGSTTWAFDKQGRLTSQTNTITGAPTSYTTDWTYDAMDRVRSMTYPGDNEVVTTTYNIQGLPITLGAYATVPTNGYNATGQLLAANFGDGTTTTYTYDSQNLRLTQLQTTGGTSPLLDLAYQYDKVGNVKTITDTNTVRTEVSTFGYDDLDRLTSVNLTGGSNPYSQGWAINPIGNITQRAGTDAATYTYDATHKHAVAQVGSAYYCYDANGNMTKRGATNSACTTGGDMLSYDTENRLTQDVTAGGVTTAYKYNGDGQRVKKVVGGTTTYYVGNYFEVTNGAATKYYYFGTQRIAMRNASGVTYIHGDHLGSTSVTSGATNSKQWYYAYGAVRASEGTLPTDYTFTGQKIDASNGLMYYGARYYDAAIGRFVQPDTIVPNASNPQSLNRYSYVLNNPIRLTDPTGFHPQHPGDLDDNTPDDSCQTDWCWKDRWYAAHGYNWDNNKSDWVMRNNTPNPQFYDRQITDAMIGEAGISLNNPAGWDWDQKKAIASGIAWFENALSGHIAQLRELVGGTTVFLGSPPICFGSPCAPPGIYRTRSDVFMRNDFIKAYGTNVAPMVFVHELGHIIDQRSSIDLNYYRGTFSQAWHGAPLTENAATGNWERFADAIGVYAFGLNYSTWQPLRNVLDIGPQRARMSALLDGLW